MKKSIAMIAQVRIRNTPGYEDVAYDFPTFKQAVEALPDTEPMDYVNVFLRPIIEDAIKWAEKITRRC